MSDTVITVTDKAKTKIQQLRKEGGFAYDYFIRVSVVSGGCSGLSYDISFSEDAIKGDQQCEHNGLKIILDMKSFLYLAGTNLDFSDGLEGKGFNFINPNASRTCACGESFSV
jgi:iron-sulfur cluster assembly protein